MRRVVAARAAAALALSVAVMGMARATKAGGRAGGAIQAVALGAAGPVRRSARLAGLGISSREKERESEARVSGKKSGAGKSGAESAKNKTTAKKPNHLAAASRVGGGFQTLSFREKSLLSSSELYTHIIGVDEVGRGCLAGPVAAGAFAVNVDVRVEPGVDDSKKIKEQERERLESALTCPEKGNLYCVKFVEPCRIDEINIRMATLEAMGKAAIDVARRLPPGSRAIVVTDGRDPTPCLEEEDEFISEVVKESIAVKGGDGELYAIAAASIIAKVRRDAMMRKYGLKWPQYKFEEHKGYGTRAHMALLKEHGPCEIHRRSYAPVREAER